MDVESFFKRDEFEATSLDKYQFDSISPKFSF